MNLDDVVPNPAARRPFARYWLQLPAYGSTLHSASRAPAHALSEGVA
ncbi:MAG: hypothetical protein QOC75_1075 [Pseudonocardiales bacterium]|nr:hypothetical protein [Pseudonocardiales bacterium]